jgi:hypothetical protein
MVDTGSDGLLAKLRLLSKRELQVLDLRCQGMKYADIGKALSIAVPTVKTDMGRVYMKLGLDVIEPSQRLKTLYDTVCPLLELIRSEMQKAKAGSVEKTPAPEVVDGEVIPEQEVPIPPKVNDMVEEDEKAIVPLRPAPLVAPPRPPRRRWWLVILIGGVVLGICLGAVAVYLLLRSSGGLFGATPQATPTANSPAATVLDPAQAPLIVLTATVTPSPQPSSTPLPTSTPYPTNTPKPSVSMPFKDDFSNGINPAWSVYSGQWLTTGTGATITITDDDPVTGALILDDPTLTNYRLRVKVHSPGVLSACQGDLGVVVRYQADRDQNLMYFMNSASRFYWGYTDSLSPSFGSATQITDVVKANIISDFVMELEASGNNFTAKIDGAKYDSFSLTGYESGGVALIPVCGCPGYCPSFSDFSLEPLP